MGLIFSEDCEDGHKWRLCWESSIFASVLGFLGRGRVFKRTRIIEDCCAGVTITHVRSGGDDEEDYVSDDC